jgi:hypothetical protein
MPFMETVFQASARHSSSLPVHLTRGSVGGEVFFLFFLPFAVDVGSGASSSSSTWACYSSSLSTSWVPSPNP